MPKKIIITIISVVAFLTINQDGFSQQSTDGKFLFKIWFFIEHVNQHSRTEKDFSIKDSLLFSLFSTVIDLKVDTLKSKSFESNFIFLSISPFKNNKRFSDSAVVYNSRTKYLGYVSIPVNNCEGYVLCVNANNGRSYRLQGFYGNDFFSFLRNVKEEYQDSNHESLSSKIFLKNYSVTDVDFNCLYKGLSSGEADKKTYPCLKICSDFIITTH